MTIKRFRHILVTGLGCRTMTIIAPVLLALVFSLNAGADETCSNRHIDETVTVAQVVDGDTVRLSDRRLVRFIGINTPEIDHKSGKSEPQARAARQMLKTLIDPSRRIKLQYGAEKKDRYGRLLAHVYDEQGNSLQQRLLQRGLAFWIVVPPNLHNMACYRQAEARARGRQQGVWSEPYYKPRRISELNLDRRGFVLLTGVIQRIGQGRRNIWLNLADNPKPLLKRHRAALRIRRSDLHYFENNGIDIQQWQGRRVTARGWVYPSTYAGAGQLVMNVKHPAVLSFEITDK